MSCCHEIVTTGSQMLHDHCQMCYLILTHITRHRNRGAKGPTTTENKRATATKAGKCNRAGEGNSVGKEEGSLQKAVRRN